MHGVTVYPFSESSIRNVVLLIFLIYFKVAFNQAFLKYAGNLGTYAKLLGSGLKCDTSETDSPKVVNELFDSFATSLKDLYKSFPVLFSESSDTFHSLCA